MATHGWRTGHTLAESLQRDSSNFNFYQAVRLLEQAKPRLLTTDVTDNALTVLEDAVLFRADIREDFLPSAISSIEFTEQKSKATLWLSRFGLAGRMGPLPQPYSSWIQDNISRGDRAMADFLDIFNHRLAILLYLARKKYCLALYYQMLDSSPPARYADCLSGFGTSGLKQRLPVEQRQLQAFAGLLANTRISLPVLKNCLSVFLGTTVNIQQFEGAWVTLEQTQCTHLGQNGNNQILGTQAMLGQKVWEQHARISITLGPLNYQNFLQFLPDSGSLFQKLFAVLEFLARRRFDIHITLSIHKQEIPFAYMKNKQPMRLGRTAWLKTRGDNVAKNSHDTQVNFVLKTA